MLQNNSAHSQYYPIQTGAFVFQKIFSHYDLVGLQRQSLFRS